MRAAAVGMDHYDGTVVQPKLGKAEHSLLVLLVSSALIYWR